MDFGLYIGIRYIREKKEERSKIRNRNLNNRSNTLKTFSIYNIIVGRIKNKKLKRLIYILTNYIYK
jgi:hypothetical protein